MDGKLKSGSRITVERHTARHGENLVRGFTLIELLVVLGIVLVVTAMAVPLVQSSLVNYQLRSSVSAVTGIIQSTRYQAISSGYPYRVSFTKTSNSFQLSSDPNVTATFANIGGAVPIAGGANSTTLGADTTLQFGGGGSVKATTGTLVLSLTRAFKTATITVSPYGNVNTTYGP